MEFRDGTEQSVQVQQRVQPWCKDQSTMTLNVMVATCLHTSSPFYPLSPLFSCACSFTSSLSPPLVPRLNVLCQVQLEARCGEPLQQQDHEQGLTAGQQGCWISQGFPRAALGKGLLLLGYRDSPSCLCASRICGDEPILASANIGSNNRIHSLISQCVTCWPKKSRTHNQVVVFASPALWYRQGTWGII